MSFAVVLLQATPTIDATVILNAIRGHQLAPVVAVVLYFLAAAIKQGWLGTWLQAKLSPRFLPFLSPVAGVLSLSSVEILAGAPWLSAVVDGLMAGLGPILGHEVVVEAWRNGKEIVPAKKSSSSGGGSIIPLAPPAPKISDKPEPPAAAYVSIVWARRVLVCFVLATMTVTTGCAAASQWWQQFINNPATGVSSLINYVRNAITSADTVWAIISPFLGAQQAQATQIFDDAKVTVVNSLAALQSAIDADAAAQNSTPDWSRLIADLKSAVTSLVAIVQQYAGSNTVVGSASGGASVTLMHAKTALTTNADAVAKWGH